MLEVNCVSVSQTFSPTKYRCMSGAVVMAPPKASTESDAKCPNNASHSALLKDKVINKRKATGAQT